jgi:hypothetical protein
MGLEENSLTIASHVVMVVILFILAARALGTFKKGLGGLAVDHGLMAVIAIACVALSIERFYYISARFLRSRDLNLWDMHPAPEVLSLIVGIGIYGIMVPLLRAQISDRRRHLSRVAWEVIGLISIWIVAVWVLY